MEEEKKQIDRISQLPDDLLIRILSFLPVEHIAQSKSVSKAWQELPELSILPPLEFEAPRHYFPISSFLDSIDSSLNKLRPDDQKKKGDFLPLSKLRLSLDPDHISSLPQIDSWIDAALQRKVGHLQLCFLHQFPSKDLYRFPNKVFRAGTITVLHLEELIMEIRGDSDINLPALRKLCLRHIQCDDQAAIQKLISSCPSIRDLETSSCYPMLGQLHVSGLVDLQRLTLMGCGDLQRIEIDAPSLQFLDFCHHPHRPPCELVFTSSCEFIGEFMLENQCMTEDFFRNLAFVFPNLERLNIICDDDLQKIVISHHRLKRLCVNLTSKKAMLKIDTPNLLSLNYKGYSTTLIPIVVSCLNISSLQEFDIFFHNYNVCSHFSKSREFFEKMRRSKVMNLQLYIKSKQDLIIPGKLRPILSPPVYDIKHLKLTVYKCCRYRYIIDRMLWLCHPQTLSIAPETNPRFLEILYNEFMNKEDHPKCCASCTTKCWRHYLEEVQIDGAESRAEIDRIIAMPNSEVRFILKWRSLLL